MPNPSKTVSGEIAHLMRDKRMPQRQAVAASLNMAREGKLRGVTRGARRGPRR